MKSMFFSKLVNKKNLKNICFLSILYVFSPDPLLAQQGLKGQSTGDNRNIAENSSEPTSVLREGPRQPRPAPQTNSQQTIPQQNQNVQVPQTTAPPVVNNKQAPNTASSHTNISTKSATIFSPPSVFYEIESFLRNNENISIFLAYLLLVWFLSAARRNPSLAIFVVNILFIVIGFPFWVLGRVLGMRSAMKGNYNPTSKQTKNKNSDDVSDQNVAPEKERILIQSQRKGGVWITKNTLSPGTSDSQIGNTLSRESKQAMHSAETPSSGWVGRVRAVGEKSGRIYDIQ